MAMVVGLMLMVLGCSSSEDDTDAADRKRCERLRDHLVELRLASVASQPDVDVTAHRTAMTSALGEQFVANCQKLTVRDVKCGLAASDLRTATMCAQSKSH
jgi:hypothetical protein